MAGKQEQTWAHATDEAASWVVLVSAAQSQHVRRLLETDGLYDDARRMGRIEDGTMAVPITDAAKELFITLSAPSSTETLASIHALHSMEAACRRVPLVPSRTAQIKSPIEVLLSVLGSRFGAGGIPAHLLAEVPRKWEVHGDLAVLHEGAFVSEGEWLAACPSLWSDVAAALRVSRLALGARISPDLKRQSQVRLVVGSHAWVEHAEGGVIYEFDVTRCMFSRGNVNERMRMGGLHCHGETVVDLYAGIGYFVIPFLARAGASFLHACEWNPNAVEALRRNLARNGVADRCEIHYGDNRSEALRERLRGVAHRINLGLIPSSEEGWPTAWAVLNAEKGGWAHVHGNVDGDTLADRTEWASHVAHAFEAGLSALHGRGWTARVGHVQRVKSYAPHIAHVVADIECRPVS